MLEFSYTLDGSVVKTATTEIAKLIGDVCLVQSNGVKISGSIKNEVKT